MGTKFNNMNVNEVKFTGLDSTNIMRTNVRVRQINLNNQIVYCHGYPLTITNNGTTLHIERTSTNEPTASLGELHNGDIVYYGDILSISVTPVEGYHNARFSRSGINNSNVVTGSDHGRQVSTITIEGTAARNTWNASVVVASRSTFTNKFAITTVGSYPFTIQVIKADGTVNSYGINYSGRHLFTGLDYDDKVRIIRNDEMGITNGMAYKTPLGEHPFTPLQRKKYYDYVTAPSTHDATKTISVSVVTSTEQIVGYQADWQLMNTKDTCFDGKDGLCSEHTYGTTYGGRLVYVRNWSDVIAYSQLDNYYGTGINYIVGQSPTSVVNNEASINVSPEAYIDAGKDGPFGLKILYKYYAGITVTTVNP